MGEASSTSTFRTLMPSRGVCGVLSIMPRICCAAASAAAGSSQSFTPPALPRPPACTWALTTTLPPSFAAIAFACAGVSATSPFGTGTPNSLRIALPWYSWIFMRSGRRLLVPANLPHDPHDRIEVVGHPLFHGNDGVVRDVDVLGADLGAALGDIAEPDAGLLAHELGAVAGVEWVHLEPRDLDEEARTREELIEIMVADDMAEVLAQEGLDAIVEI